MSVEIYLSVFGVTLLVTIIFSMIFSFRITKEEYEENLNMDIDSDKLLELEKLVSDFKKDFQIITNTNTILNVNYCKQLAKMIQQENGLDEKYLDYIRDMILIPKDSFIDALECSPYFELPKKKKIKLIRYWSAKYDVTKIIVLRRIKQIKILQQNLIVNNIIK